MRSLDDLLDDAGLDVGVVSEPMAAALADLVTTTQTAARRRHGTSRVRSRRPRRAILAGSAATVVFIGSGAAATVTTGNFAHWIAPWTADPTGTLSFTLPSGGVCEQRIGDLTVANPEAQDMIHAWLASHTLAEITDIDAAIAAIRAEGPQTHSFSGDTGVRVDVVFGYGTANYDADYEYVDAVFRAEDAAIKTKLRDEGYTDYEDFNFTWSSELQCKGSNPNPAIPEFAK